MTTEGKCDVCGREVERGGEPVTVTGWYSGHRYAWVDGGLRLLRVRCPEHHPLNREPNATDEFGEPCIAG